MLTGPNTPFRIENIRQGRKKPGLLRQHLACIRASQEICNAKVAGDELGSQCVEFTPDKIASGTYKFSIGTAGSTSLVLQTVLPALLRAKTESTVMLEGGTHNQGAPSFEFISSCFIPVLDRMNISVEAALDKYGFYPNGGGAWTAKITPPAEPTSLYLVEKGALLARKGIAISSHLPAHITERELSYVQRKLSWHSNELEQKPVNSFGPGNLLSLQLSFEQLTEVFDSVGALGLSAERVAGRAIRDLKRYLASEAVVGEHLADQLLLPMALGKGGIFRTLAPSMHTFTNIEVIRQFLDCDIKIENIGEDLTEISVV